MPSSAGPLTSAASFGVVVGTLIGKTILGWIPEPTFRRLIAAVVLTLGLWMLVHPGA